MSVVNMMADCPNPANISQSWKERTGRAGVLLKYQHSERDWLYFGTSLWAIYRNQRWFLDTGMVEGLVTTVTEKQCPVSSLRRTQLDEWRHYGVARVCEGHRGSQERAPSPPRAGLGVWHQSWSR